MRAGGEGSIEESIGEGFAVSAAGSVISAEARPAGERLSRVIATSAVVEATGFGTAQLIRLVSNLILTRILFPSAFGLMAMLSLILYGLVMLSDVGLQQAVIRSPRGDDPEYLDTAWTIQALRGVMLWIASCAVAWPISVLFRERVLLAIIPVGAAVTLLNGLASTRILTLRRRLRPLPIVVLELCAQVAGVVGMIALARGGLGVWALVAGTIITAVIHTGFSYALPGTHRERFRIDRSCRDEISGFGRWIFASSAMTFVAGRGDQFIVGRALGTASLGLYNIGLNLAELPDALVNRLTGSVLFPLYARLLNERRREFTKAYYLSRAVFDTLVHAGLGGIAALAPWIIHVMYDARYQGAAAMLRLLAVRCSIGLWATPCEVALVAMGLSKYGFRRNLFVAVATMVCMPVGAAVGGPTGLIWGSAVARVAGIAALWPAAREQGVLHLGRELLVPAMLAAGFGLGTGLLWILPR